MSTLIVAYVACWLAVTFYIFQLGGRQRQIVERIAALQLRLQDIESSACGDQGL